MAGGKINWWLLWKTVWQSFGWLNIEITHKSIPFLDKYLREMNIHMNVHGSIIRNIQENMQTTQIPID
jgi:hypothetical protein